MPRYTIKFAKQRDTFSCGPVAILNAFKWMGAKAPYKKYIKTISFMCGCNSDTGTQYKKFDSTLRNLGKDLLKIKRKYRPTLKEIETHLKNNGAIILNYRIKIDKKMDIEHRHYILVVGVSNSGNAFWVVNLFSKGPALRKLTRKKFKFNFLRFSKSDKSFKGWFLTKYNSNSKYHFYERKNA